ncbi:putative GTPase-activating protein, partial [Trachipleistophora hominis]
VSLKQHKKMYKQKKIAKFMKTINTVSPKERISMLHTFPENAACNDCKSTNPTWANLNFGVLLCTACAGTHRENKHYKVRSLLFDRLSDDEVLRVLVGGNGNHFGDSDDVTGKYREYGWYVDELTERVRRLKESGGCVDDEVVHDAGDKAGVRMERTLKIVKTKRTTKIGSKSIEELRKKRESEGMKDKAVVKEVKKQVVVKEVKPKAVQETKLNEPTVVTFERGTGAYTLKGQPSGDVGLLDTKSEDVNGNGYNYKNIKFHSVKKEKSVIKKVAEGSKNVVSGLINKFNK